MSKRTSTRFAGVKAKGASIDGRKICRKMLLPCAAGMLAFLLAGGLKAYENYVDEVWIKENLLFDSRAYSSLASCLGFLIVFRTAQSYNRYWNGIDLVYEIMGHWLNVASNLLSYARHTKKSEIDVSDFRNLVVRMFSLLNCLVVMNLEGREAHCEADLKYHLIDFGGIDEVTRKNLLASNGQSQVEQCFQMINKMVMEAIKTGLVAIPPPIATRIFQEMAAGMLKQHSAEKLFSVDFPAPYVIALRFILTIHLLMTPVAVINWADTIAFSALFCFVLVGSMWALMELAIELDNPYVDSGFGFDRDLVQRTLNEALVTILVEEEAPMALLSEDAELLNETNLYGHGDTLKTHVGVSPEGQDVHQRSLAVPGSVED